MAEKELEDSISAITNDLIEGNPIDIQELVSIMKVMFLTLFGNDSRRNVNKIVDKIEKIEEKVEEIEEKIEEKVGKIEEKIEKIEHIEDTVLKIRINPKINVPRVSKRRLVANRHFELILKIFSKSHGVRPSN